MGTVRARQDRPGPTSYLKKARKAVLRLCNQSDD